MNFRRFLTIEGEEIAKITSKFFFFFFASGTWVISWFVSALTAPSFGMQCLVLSKDLNIFLLT